MSWSPVVCPFDPVGSPLMDNDRRRVIYRGHVQGVGFRATTQQIAMGYDVAGHVKNLPDGTVEVMVWGRSREIDAFLAEIKAELGPRIDHAEISTFSWESDEPSGFSIRY